MMILIAFIAGILFSAAFPGPAGVVRSMVAYCWNSAVAWWQNFRTPRS